MAGPPPDWPTRDPGVFSRPGAASIRPAALWDALYELAIGNAVGISAGGAQLLVDQGIAAHEAKPDPHPVYVTVPEGDARWGTPGGMVVHAHLDPASGGLIDYLRTQWGVDHLAAANPHPQYPTTPAVQAQIDGAIAALKAEADPFPVYLTDAQAATTYLTQATAAATYLPLSHQPGTDPHPQYLTPIEGDARYAPISGGSLTVLREEEFLPGAGATTVTLSATPVSLLNVFRNGVEQSIAAGHYSWSGGPTITFSDAFVAGERVSVTGSMGTTLVADSYTRSQANGRFVAATGGEVAGALSVQERLVDLSAETGNTLVWTAAGLYSDSPTRAAHDALLARVATLEAQVASLRGQMGAGANGHYHTMGTWRQTNTATLPATVLEEAPAV